MLVQLGYTDTALVVQQIRMYEGQKFWQVKKEAILIWVVILFPFLVKNTNFIEVAIFFYGKAKGKVYK